MWLNNCLYKKQVCDCLLLAKYECEKNFGRRYWLSTRARVCVSLRLPVDGLEEPLGKATQLLNRSLAFVLQPAVLLGQPTDGMLE